VSLREALAEAGIDARFDEPLSRHGFYRLGGPAEAFAVIETEAALSRLMSTGLPVTVIGNGSNLLVSDAGVRGVVVRLKGDFLASTVRDDASVVAGGGLLNTVLLRRLDRVDLGGLGCLAGVPGTIGGAVRMNAGWSVGELADRLIDVDIILPGGALTTLPAAALEFSYRRAAGLPAGAVVSRARLSLLSGTSADEERATVQRYLARRKATQPLDRPSCGSVFKNPPGDYAGRLIEASGLKGASSGGAQISERHANFIVNHGTATAQDVYDLIRLARRTVWREHAVLLVPEVHAIGAWSEGAWPLPHPEHDED
jgi:UDP-N-acetylmuramate dehydrogenase